MLIFFKN